MSNDKIDDAKRTTRGAVDRANTKVGEARDTAEEAADRVGAVDDLERERDEIEEDYERTLRALQSNSDQTSNVMEETVGRVGDLYNQILADRRTFLGAIGAAAFVGADYANILSRDSDCSGHFNEEPTNYAKGNIDGFGTFGDQPSCHEVAEGRDSRAVKAIEETIDRPVFPEVFENIDRSSKVEIMSPQSRDAYFDGEGAEFYSMDVHYDPEGGRKSSSIKINYFNMGDFEGYEDVTEKDVGSSGWRNVGDDVALDVVQTYDEVTK